MYNYLILTPEQVRLLDRYSPALDKVKLSELIDNALVVSAGEIPDGAITALKLASNAVETIKIKDANVTLSKLATGIKPSHIAVFAGKHTTVGGAAAESITVTGALGTDIVVTSLQAVGAVPRTLVTSAPATDSIDLVFSDDPSTDHVVSYVVYRAVA